MKIIECKPFPPNSNPFKHDAFNMGEYLGSNVAIMFGNHSLSHCDYLYVINTETGERIRIEFK